MPFSGDFGHITDLNFTSKGAVQLQIAAECQSWFLLDFGAVFDKVVQKLLWGWLKIALGSLVQLQTGLNCILRDMDNLCLQGITNPCTNDLWSSTGLHSWAPFCLSYCTWYRNFELYRTKTCAAVIMQVTRNSVSPKHLGTTILLKYWVSAL